MNRKPPAHPSADASEGAQVAEQPLREAPPTSPPVTAPLANQQAAAINGRARRSRNEALAPDEMSKVKDTLDLRVALRKKSPTELTRPEKVKLLDNLISALRKANHIYKTRDAREGVDAALFAVLKLLATLDLMGTGEHLSEPLFSLSRALADLDEGIPSPLLAPRDKGKPGRKPDPSAWSEFTAYIAATTRAYADLGDPNVPKKERLAEAYTKVARHLRDHLRLRQVAAREEEITAKTVKHWCARYDLDYPNGDLGSQIQSVTLSSISRLLENVAPERKRPVLLAQLDVMAEYLRIGDIAAQPRMRPDED